MLTFVLFRRPLAPSIQMYSARTLPFWSNFMYLANCDRWVRRDAKRWEKCAWCSIGEKTHVGGIGNDGGLDTSLRNLLVLSGCTHRKSKFLLQRMAATHHDGQIRVSGR